ncbi:AAA family ATPase [Hoyosella sp. YIM 151337]|uniref:AAA family ATPase n=1 Tax=Hoyosella sp. YIM 151337 TaxID=2992742 RepID=UPI002236951B|nr:AAA family ATPase [Hoyosella sp. YIM 151337]MCW4355626.1 AAA family ATPase [Hoyosella sp. YIM 151337]
MLYGRLDALRDNARRNLAEVMRERGGTPQAQSERESYNAMYTAKLAKYLAAENGLCFGRIDLGEGEGEARYVGRLGMWDEDSDFDPLLLDWRAPMARPFYLATPASPEGVTRRRHIRTRGRTVTALNDEYLDPEALSDVSGTNGSATTSRGDEGGVASENALLAAMSAARTGHMVDIVATIQREQDEIIRSEHRSVLVVQGGPGTGKTAVALHRAAFLLYTYREQLERSGVLIIGPNDTFLKYISQVLPSLGETGVVLSTVGDLYPGVTASGHDSLESSAIKGSLDMVTVLKNAVRDRQELPSSPVEIEFDTYTLTIDRKLITRARGRARSSRRPHNRARDIFFATAIEGLADQYAAIVGANLIDRQSLLSRDDIADVRDEMRQDPTFRTVIGSFWPHLTPQDVLSELFSSDDRLSRAAPDLSDAERAHLVRPRAAPFTPGDAPLLDELAELLGVDGDDDDRQAQARWRAKIEEAQEALDILTGSAPQDLEDDLDPEILMAYDLIDAEQLAERQEYRQSRTTAERAAADRQWTYGHAIIDEAQELSEMAWRMVMRRVPNRWMTVVGDPAQTGSPAGASSWDAALEPYVARRWKLTELSINYRTPSEIMAVAAGVLEQISPNAVPPKSIRESGHIPWARQIPHGELTSAVAEQVTAWLREQDAGTVAVIASERLAAQFAELNSDAVSVLVVREAKGLEFDSVLLVEPEELLAESPRGLNDIYVACTRATQRLGVLHAEELPKCLSFITD